MQKYLFDKIWFTENQKKLLWLANTFFIKYFFRKFLGIENNKKISFIGNNNFTTDLGLKWTKKQGIRHYYTQEFYNRNVFSDKFYHKLYPIWWLFHQWDMIFANNFAPQLNLGFDTLTVYPNATPTDSHTATKNDFFGIQGNEYEYQTFTPSVAYPTTSVDLLLYRVGSPGTITVELFAVDGSHKPTGSALASGTTSGDTLTTSTDGEYRKITWSSAYSLSASTEYAIRAKATSGDGSNYACWNIVFGSGGYTGGLAGRSTDAGVNYTTYATSDFDFKVYGNTVDGVLVRSAVDQTLADIRAGAGTSNDYASADIQIVRLQASTTSGQYKDLRRGILLFDTSGLPDTATISEAILSFVANASTDTLSGSASDNSAIVLVASTPASNIVLENADFSQVGTTDFGRSAKQGSLTIDSSTYNNITLNASGISAISKTGITKFAMRYGWDFDNTATGLTWSSEGIQRISIATAEAGTATTPKLVITYSTVVAPTVTTQDADTLNFTSVRGNGNITDTGGANATRRGFCYKTGTSGDPTVADSTAYDDGDYGTGAYTKSITGLTSGTDYRVRAYAINSAGTSYGSTVQTRTLDEYVSNISDTINASEVMTALRARISAISDTINASEIMTSLKGLGAVLVDTINTAEILVLERTWAFISSETINVAETIKGDLDATIQDVVNASEVMTAIAGKIFTAIENINLSEVMTGLRARISEISDSIGLTETLTAFRNIVSSVSDTINTSEVMTAIRGVVLVFSETIQITSSIVFNWLKVLVKPILNTIRLVKPKINKIDNNYKPKIK